MKTVFDVKKALDQETMINVVNQHRKEVAQAQKVVKFRKRRNKWSDVFPVCK
jgi:hypothetical protein